MRWYVVLSRIEPVQYGPFSSHDDLSQFVKWQGQSMANVFFWMIKHE